MSSSAGRAMVSRTSTGSPSPLLIKESSSLPGVFYKLSHDVFTNICFLCRGLDFLEKRLEEVKLGLSNAIQLVSKKQEKVIENQESLQNSLEQVDLRYTHTRILALVPVLSCVRSVEGVREQVSGLQHMMFGVASNVDSVKSKQDEAGVKIDKWGKGIQLLCDVVGDSVSEHPQLQHKAIALKRFASESGTNIALFFLCFSMFTLIR